MKSIRAIQIVIVAMVAILMTCCKEYGDDLRDIGGRVETLEASVKKLNSDIDALSSILKAIEGHLYITNVAKNADGSYTLTFSDGSTKVLHDGADGVSKSTLVITVAQDTDGVWYWKINGEWLLDNDGNKMRANGVDGATGSDNTIVPQMRVNSETDMWEISTDGGASWTSTGVKASGEDGKDLTYAVISSITVSADGTIVTIVLADGTTIVLPCKA